MSGAQDYTLTAEQQIRLAVFQSIAANYDSCDYVEVINTVSAAIIGEGKATEDAQVIYEGMALTDIPEWANYVAGDGDGDVYFYENAPAVNSHGEWCNEWKLQAIVLLAWSFTKETSCLSTTKACTT